MEKLQDLFLNYFLKRTSIKTVSCDKMMVKSKGPVWHKKQKEAGIIPKGLRGLDKEARWSFSKADYWVYGHGTFCITTHKIPVVGSFLWMKNSSNEAKKMRQHIWRHSKDLKNVCMDSKADDQKLYFDFKKKLGIQLLTKMRKNKIKAPLRKQMEEELSNVEKRMLYQERSVTVEPMQGLISEIFDLDRCWMRRDKNNRWIFASMGVAVQIAQLRQFNLGKSTWSIKNEVLGL